MLMFVFFNDGTSLATYKLATYKIITYELATYLRI